MAQVHLPAVRQHGRARDRLRPGVGAYLWYHARMSATKNFFLIPVLLLAGCGTVSTQITPQTLSRNFGLERQTLVGQGMAFLTPA